MKIKPIILDSVKFMNIQDVLDISIRGLKNYSRQMSTALQGEENDKEQPNVISGRAYAHILAIAEIFKPLRIEDQVHNHLLWVWYSSTNIYILEWQPWTVEKLDTIVGTEREMYFANEDREAIKLSACSNSDCYNVTGMPVDSVYSKQEIVDYLQLKKMAQVSSSDRSIITED